MSNNYLTEDDFNFQADNSALKIKAEDIVNFTSSVLLDISNENLVVINSAEEVFKLLKESLFANSDTVLKSKLLGFTEDEKTKVDEVQRILLDKWKEFGLTEGFFHRYFQVQRKLNSAELTDVQKEQLDLLLKVLNEQKTLVIAFNVMAGMENPVMLDVADYM
jgi:hypothetical protein